MAYNQFTQQISKKRVVWHMGWLYKAEGSIELCRFGGDILVFFYYDVDEDNPPVYGEDTVAVFKIYPRIRHWD